MQQSITADTVTAEELESLFSSSFPTANPTLSDVVQHCSRTRTLRSEAAIGRAIEKLAARQEVMRAEFQAEEDAMLACEVAGKANLKNAHERAIGRLDYAMQVLRHERCVSELDELYVPIDPWFLETITWSEALQCSVPQFGIFSINDANCQVEVDVKLNSSGALTTSLWITPNIAKRFFDCGGLKLLAAEKMFEQIAKLPLPAGEPVARRWLSSESNGPTADASLYAKIKFSGVIPPHVRESIRVATTHFEQIFIVAEAPAWNVTSTASAAASPIPVGDPLVIGVTKEGLFWLVAEFDTTEIERYVLSESTRP